MGGADEQMIGADGHMGRWWEGFDWRFIQTNLREIDMADISAGQYVADLKRFHATIAMINTAGIVASYKTKLQYHYQSRFLTGDSLADIIEACHGEGIKVFARTDFSKIRRRIYEERPEWAYRTLSGDIVDYGGDVHTCINGGYQREYSQEIIQECITEPGHDFDGIFFNMGGYQVRDYSGTYYGICHCKSCQKLFYEMYGALLPVREDMADPLYRKYAVFKAKTEAAHNARIAHFVKSIRPDMLVNADFWTESSGMLRQESNTALDRALPHWQYCGSENAKWLRSSYPTYISSNAAVDFIDYAARHTAVSPAMQEARLWQGLANAGHLDYFIMGRLDNHDDKSGFEGVIKVFDFHKKHQELYRDNISVANIAMVTPDHWGGFGASGTEEAGIYRMLAEGHHLFDVVVSSRILDVDLAKYELLILPGLKNIGDTEASAIDGFVGAGGKLVITGKTGIFDGDAEPRAIPALQSSGMVDFGVTQNARGAYFRISNEDHARFPRFDGVNLVFIDGDYEYASYSQGVQPILSMIPPQPFGPPERCYPLYPAGGNPAAALNRYRGGICVTIPWNPGALFHRQGYSNTMDFFLDIIEAVLDVKPVRTDLPPMAEVTLLRDLPDSRRLLHIVNQTGHFGTSFYPPVTISKASCAIPSPMPPYAVRSLVSGHAVPFAYDGGILTLSLSDICIFEAIHIAYE